VSAGTDPVKPVENSIKVNLLHLLKKGIGSESATKKSDDNHDSRPQTKRENASSKKLSKKPSVADAQKELKISLTLK